MSKFNKFMLIINPIIFVCYRPVFARVDNKDQVYLYSPEGKPFRLNMKKDEEGKIRINAKNLNTDRSDDAKIVVKKQLSDE